MQNIRQSPYINYNITSVLQNRPRPQRYGSLDQSSFSKQQWNIGSKYYIQTKNQKKPYMQRQRNSSQQKLTLTSSNNKSNSSVNNVLNNNINNINNTNMNSNINNSNSYINDNSNIFIKKNNLHVNSPSVMNSPLIINSSSSNNINQYSSSKIITLQKKCKFNNNSLKNSQISNKWTGSMHHINIDQNNYLKQQNQHDKSYQNYQTHQKTRSRGLIEINQINNIIGSNNNYMSNPEYLINNNNKSNQILHISNINTPNGLNLRNSQLQINENKKQIFEYFNQKLLKQQQKFNNIITQNEYKIKLLQKLLLSNKQQIQAKNIKIRQLQQILNKPQSLMSNKTNFDYYSRSVNILNNNKINQSNQMNYQFILNKIQDLTKKQQLLTKYSSNCQQLINEKIQKTNNLINNVVNIKLKNIRFILKVFMQKCEKNMIRIDEKTNSVRQIIMHQLQQKIQKDNSIAQQLNQCILQLRKKCYKNNNLQQSYLSQQNIRLSNIYSKSMHSPKTVQQLKNTINTFISTQNSNRKSNSYKNNNINNINSISCMFQSHDMSNMMNMEHNNNNNSKNHNIQQQNSITTLNQSFLNHLQDYQIRHQQDQSFTDDSFSYAPNETGSTDINNSVPIVNFGSAVNQFDLGTYPSFSKLSGTFSKPMVGNNYEFNNNNITMNNQIKQSIQLSTESSSSGVHININNTVNNIINMNKNKNNNTNNINDANTYFQTIQQIVKFRNGSILVYIDDHGLIRYKGSASCIFDKKGNILKPTKEQIQISIQKAWITFQ